MVVEMATYRPLKSSIWIDPDFEKYTPSEKLLFIYLTVNMANTESGIYPISLKTISYHTGIPISKVKYAFEKTFKSVSYDFDKSCVFVKNFLIHNGRGNPEKLLLSIQNDYLSIKTSLWDIFFEKYSSFLIEKIEKIKDFEKTLESLYKVFYSNRYRYSNSNSNSNESDCKDLEPVDNSENKEEIKSKIRESLNIKKTLGKE
jgi:hypothetical protein